MLNISIFFYKIIFIFVRDIFTFIKLHLRNKFVYHIVLLNIIPSLHAGKRTISYRIILDFPLSNKFHTRYDRIFNATFKYFNNY